MAAEPEDDATAPDEQPFSPSIFLNLPPTPPHHHSNDHHQYHPDHQGLVQSQQTSTAILPAGSDQCAASVSPCFFPDAAPVWDWDWDWDGNASWPYHPVELSQKLLSAAAAANTPYPADNMARTGHDGDANAVSLHEWDGSGSSNSDGFWQNKGSTMTTPASASPGNGERDALFFGGGAGESETMTYQNQNRVTMDMLNQAFLKGMEEASKFLPNNNSLLVHSKPGHVIAPGQKRHSWETDNLEADSGRKSKVVAPEAEETGEMVDRLVLVGYQSLIDKMTDMSIAVDSEAAENNKARKKGKRNKFGASGTSSSNKDKEAEEEAVDLLALLLQCAQAMATGHRHGAAEMLCKVKRHSSPTGDATQRLAYYFARGLDARLAGTGSQLYRSPMAKKHTSAMEFIKAYQVYLSVSCFEMMAFKFSNLTICKAIAGRRKKKVHIVDYGEDYGFHWPTLLGFWGTQTTWEEGEGPPEVRITFVGLPRPAFCPAARIEEAGRRLATFARQCGIPFRYRCIAAKWETVCAEDLDIEPDEVLVVNGLFHFGRVMDDEGIGNIYGPSPRDLLLGNIQKMRPHVFILCVENGLHNSTPYFLGRFQEALLYYSSMFDMMDAVAPQDSDHRLLVEQYLFGRRVLNIVACEGFDRVERPETYKQWQVRNDRAGLRQLPLDPDVVKAVSEKVRDNYHRDFVIYEDKKWLLQGWKGRILYAMSTWVAKDGISNLC